MFFIHDQKSPLSTIQMPYIADQHVLEIPDSDEDSDTEPLGQGYDALTVASDEIDTGPAIEHFFPKGGGLFKRPQALSPSPESSLSPKQPSASEESERTSSTRTSISSSTKKTRKSSGIKQPVQASKPLVLRRSTRKTAKPVYTDHAIATQDGTSKSDVNDSCITNSVSFIQVPTRCSSGGRDKIYRQNRQVQPWATGEPDSHLLECYKLTLTGIEAIFKQYRIREESPSAEDSLQWPIFRHKNRKHKLLHCLCRSDTIQRTKKSDTQRCYDPACEVQGGWYHLSCLSDEELRDILTMPKWICRRCLERREEEGFPELQRNSLADDRYAQLVRKVLAWKETLPKQCKVESGLTSYEEAKAAMIDIRLWERGCWPRPGDEVLNKYWRWAGAA